MLLIVLCLLYPDISQAQESFGATGVYGLRKIIPSYAGNAVQVRRTCDNATANIGFNSCGGLDTAALLSFALASNPLSAMAAASTTAYSLRKLNCAYAGKAINVRRSSDNATLDIGFTASGDLDTASLKIFVGAGSGYVVKWYDQSGNTRDASQATAANQPRIVNGGVVDRCGTMPAIYYGGMGIGLFTAPFTAYTTNVCYNGVAKVNTDLTYNAFITKTNVNIPASLDFYNNTLIVGDGTSYTFFYPTQSFNAAAGQCIWTMEATKSSNVNVYFNGTNVLSTTVNANFNDVGNPMAIGTRNDGVTGLNGWISEVMSFATIPSNTDRAFLEYTQSTYYNVGGIPLGTLPAGAANAYVTSWYDQTGNGNTFLQATNAQQLQLMNVGSISRLSKQVTMQATSASQTNLTLTLGANYTGNVVTGNSVVQADLATNNKWRIMSVGNSALTSADWNNTSNFDVDERGAGPHNFVVSRNSAANSNTAIVAGSPLAMSILFDGTNHQLFNNGTGAGAVADNTAFSFQAVRVMQSINPATQSTEGMTGKMSEFNFFLSALKVTQRKLLESNQGAYYNLTIAGTQYTPPAAYTYHLYVNGVGRETATDSINATRYSSGMGFQIGTAATDFLKDNGDYLVAGMDCPLTPDGSNANLPAGVNTRWANDWYINKTDINNNNGTVKIYFDFTDYNAGGGPGVAANYVLLNRPNTAATFAIVTVTSTTVSGNRVIFTLDASNIPTNYYYTIGTSNNGTSPLPVQWLFFTASPCEKDVCLSWATATETNNAFFMLERSADAWVWEDVKRVNGAGNSSTVNRYQALDKMPLPNRSYYRLRQTDFNGLTSYSNIVPVVFGGVAEPVFYPNPAQDLVYIQCEGKEIITVELSDLTGRSVMPVQHISLMQNQGTIDIHSLRPGIYHLRYTTDTGIKTIKLLVTRP
ncbi:MAG TPA: arabinofuranosidase catalytic domain-containing protein [Bacteroidia bacterium]|nr:arabinofuranosidase catalytic domain-containing protein [Bacteroidia bacterium]